MSTTSKQVSAYVLACAAIAEAVRGLGEVPEGHLYTRVMDKMDLATFTGIVDRLVGAGLVHRAGSHMLTWTGPKGGAA